jgi:hypothetical protein
MKIKDYIIGTIFSIVFGFAVIYLINFYTIKINSNRIIRYQTTQETKEQIQFLRDSFEMRYYKKQLESYPYEHSKIPTDNTKK